VSSLYRINARKLEHGRHGQSLDDYEEATERFEARWRRERRQRQKRKEARENSKSQRSWKLDLFAFGTSAVVLGVPLALIQSVVPRGTLTIEGETVPFPPTGEYFAVVFSVMLLALFIFHVVIPHAPRPVRGESA